MVQTFKGGINIITKTQTALNYIVSSYGVDIYYDHNSLIKELKLKKVDLTDIYALLCIISVSGFDVLVEASKTLEVSETQLNIFLKTAKDETQFSPEKILFLMEMIASTLNIFVFSETKDYDVDIDVAFVTPVNLCKSELNDYEKKLTSNAKFSESEISRLTLLADRGMAQASYILGSYLYPNILHKKQGLEYLEKASAMGYAQATAKLGMNAYRKNSPYSYEKALEFFKSFNCVNYSKEMLSAITNILNFEKFNKKSIISSGFSLIIIIALIVISINQFDFSLLCGSLLIVLAVLIYAYRIYNQRYSKFTMYHTSLYYMIIWIAYCLFNIIGGA